MNPQMSLFEDPLFQDLSYKTLFWYPGSKVLAVPTISKLIPTEIKEMVSPFLGGGSLELWLSARGTKVYAYDKNEQLINLWKHIISDGLSLSFLSKKILNELSRDKLIEQIELNKDHKDNLIRASYFYLKQCLSWNGQTNSKSIGHYEIIDRFAFYKKKNGNLGEKLTRFTRVENFYNPNLIIKEAIDFEKSLEKHKDLFAYLDPPYDCGKSKHYGVRFDHKRLAEILTSRKSPFLLSYYDTNLIQKLYPSNRFHRIDRSWYQVNRQNQIVKKEVLICNKSFFEIMDGAHK